MGRFALRIAVQEDFALHVGHKVAPAELPFLAQLLLHFFALTVVGVAHVLSQPLLHAHVPVAHAVVLEKLFNFALVLGHGVKALHDELLLLVLGAAHALLDGVGVHVYRRALLVHDVGVSKQQLHNGFAHHGPLHLQDLHFFHDAGFGFFCAQRGGNQLVLLHRHRFRNDDAIVVHHARVFGQQFQEKVLVQQVHGARVKHGERNRGCGLGGLSRLFRRGRFARNSSKERNHVHEAQEIAHPALHFAEKGRQLPVAVKLIQPGIRAGNDIAHVIAVHVAEPPVRRHLHAGCIALHLVANHARKHVGQGMHAVLGELNGAMQGGVFGFKHAGCLLRCKLHERAKCGLQLGALL